jgi:hypothetical protein
MNEEALVTIAKDLGIDSLPSEEQGALIEQFGSVALKAATLALLEHIPEDKQEEFASLAEGTDMEKMQQFLDATVPGHEAITKAAVDEEVRRFRAYQIT